MRLFLQSENPKITVNKARGHSKYMHGNNSQEETFLGNAVFEIFNKHQQGCNEVKILTGFLQAPRLMVWTTGYP